jgi:hypothetical protein
LFPSNFRDVALQGTRENERRKERALRKKYQSINVGKEHRFTLDSADV